MKIRTGFVSNSSSSAFILLVKKDVYDQAYAKMDIVQKAFCDEFFQERIGVMVLADVIGLAGDFRDDFNPSKEMQDLIDEKYGGCISEVQEQIESDFDEIDGTAVYSSYIGRG